MDRQIPGSQGNMGNQEQQTFSFALRAYNKPNYKTQLHSVYDSIRCHKRSVHYAAWVRQESSRAIRGRECSTCGSSTTERRQCRLSCSACRFDVPACCALCAVLPPCVTLSSSSDSHKQAKHRIIMPKEDDKSKGCEEEGKGCPVENEVGCFLWTPSMTHKPPYTTLQPKEKDLV